MSLGFDPETFWDQTFETLQLCLDGKGEALAREHNERAWLAWHTAVLQRIDPKKFPKLEKLLHQGHKPKRAQTPAEMIEVAAMIVALHGGEDKRKLN